MIAERFHAKVSLGGPDDCWLWTGARDRGGYSLSRLATMFAVSKSTAAAVISGASWRAEA